MVSNQLLYSPPKFESTKYKLHNRFILGEFNFREEKESGDFKQVVKAKNVVMMAGGTGIAPMLQIVRDVLKDQSDTVSIPYLRILYAIKCIPK